MHLPGKKITRKKGDFHLKNTSDKKQPETNKADQHKKEYEERYHHLKMY